VGWEGWGPGSWPSSFPYLNPIENVSHILKCVGRKRDHIPRTEEELDQALVGKWEKLDMNKINKPLLTMPERLEAVQKAHGGAIPY
jgi:hypothetical protein